MKEAVVGTNLLFNLDKRSGGGRSNLWSETISMASDISR